MNPKKILIFANIGIGNLIMFIPTLKAFKNHFSNAKFSLVANKKHLVLFKELLDSYVVNNKGLIDELIAFNGRDASFAERMKFINKIRKSQFDMVVKNFLGGINLMIGLSETPHRVGHISSPDFPMRGSFMFNYPVTMDKEEHEINRNLRLFYTIGGKETDANKDFKFIISESNRKYAMRIFKQNNIRKEDKVMGMQIGTSTKKGWFTTTFTMEWKEWSYKKFGKLANALIQKEGIKILLLGAKDAVNKGKIVEMYCNTPSLVNLIGKTSIMEASAIIKKCQIFISNDGGLMWVSQAVDTPVIAIYGPTDYKRTGPIGPNDKIIRKDLPCSPCYKSPRDYKKAGNCKNRICLNSITVQEVLQAVEKSLKIN
ncbi:glycosyltransferase family 9 protein [candidate division WOR-3 bacterium]|nr:glycosyltransferase family 9 protein [candidate division WOR-3 bacterium]